MANDKDPVFCAADIIKRAKLAKEFKTDSELAAFLGISRSTLSNWNARNSIDFPLLLGSLDDVDYNWLLTGKGSPAHHSKFCDNDLVQGEVEILHTPKTADPMDDRSVTLYDISAAANLKTLLADRPQYALGRIVLPTIPVCDGAVYVSGDSMYPIPVSYTHLVLPTISTEILIGYSNLTFCTANVTRYVPLSSCFSVSSGQGSITS